LKLNIFRGGKTRLNSDFLAEFAEFFGFCLQALGQFAT
jgi:hypothetical protein